MSMTPSCTLSTAGGGGGDAEGEVLHETCDEVTSPREQSEETPRLASAPKSPARDRQEVGHATRTHRVGSCGSRHPTQFNAHFASLSVRFAQQSVAHVQS